MSDDLTLWTVADISAYLKCGRSTVYRFMRHPDFPEAIRPPCGGHPRWLAAQVRAWRLHQNSAKAA